MNNGHRETLGKGDMAMKNGSLVLMKKCPRFDRCNAPDCPLDLNLDKITRLKDEPKCDLPKRRRMKIAEGSTLMRRGMTKKEWGGYMSWQKLTPAQKRAKSANLKRGS